MLFKPLFLKKIKPSSHFYFTLAKSIFLNNPFFELYKTYTNAELLEIINNKEDYQQLAIQTAETELNSRQLTPELLKIAKEELKKKEEEEFEKIKKQQALEKSIRSYTDKLISNFTPEANPTADKRINLICITIILILLFNLITNFRTLIIAIKDFRFSPTATILEFMPFFFVPIGVYYFWKRQNFGWIIIAAWLTFTCLSIIGSFLLEQQYSDSSGFFSLFYQKHNITYFLFPFLLYGGFLVYINFPVIKKEFKLKPDTQFATIGLTIVLSILLLFMALA